jgi:hypothetical protein
MITNDNWVCYPTSGIVANIQLLYIILWWWYKHWWFLR